jgi:hypothetical protein
VTIAALIADPTRAGARHQAAPINDSGEHLKGTQHPIPGWRLDSPEHVRTIAVRSIGHLSKSGSRSTATEDTLGKAHLAPDAL